MPEVYIIVARKIFARKIFFRDFFLGGDVLTPPRLLRLWLASSTVVFRCYTMHNAPKILLTNGVLEKVLKVGYC